MAISNAEKEIFHTLRNEVIPVFRHDFALLRLPQVRAFSAQLRRNARIMDELDVIIGFAILATEFRLVRPVISDE